MSEQVEPVLSAEEWRHFVPPQLDARSRERSFAAAQERCFNEGRDMALAALLLAEAGYFTWDMVDYLREVAGDERTIAEGGEGDRMATAIADAIERILSPHDMEAKPCKP